MYCYQRICGGTPEWPDNLSEIYNGKKSEIDNVYKDLEAINVPRPVTLQSLSRNPGSYIPMLAAILKKNEQKYQQMPSAEPQQDKNSPRLFSLAPVPSLKWRFITINPNVLAAFAGKKLPDTYEGKLEMFNQVFNFQRLRIDRSVVIITHLLVLLLLKIIVALLKL